MKEIKNTQETGIQGTVTFSAVLLAKYPAKTLAAEKKTETQHAK